MNQNPIIKPTSNLTDRNYRDMLAIQLRERGCTVQEIADSIGTTTRTANRIFREYSVNKPKKSAVKTPTRREKFVALAEKMVELRNQGYENGEIAEMLGVCYQTVLLHIGKQPSEMTSIRLRCNWEHRRIEEEHRAQKAAAAQSAAKAQEQKIKSVVTLCRRKLNPYEYDLLVREINRPTAA